MSSEGRGGRADQQPRDTVPKQLDNLTGIGVCGSAEHRTIVSFVAHKAQSREPTKLPQLDPRSTDGHGSHGPEGGCAAFAFQRHIETEPPGLVTKVKGCRVTA